jgi:hypothetical protein
MSRALDVVTLTGEEYDDLMECKEMVTSLLAQLSAAKDRIAELTPVAGMDWREQTAGLRYATRRGPSCRWRMMPPGSLPPTCGAAASGARTKWGAADLGQSNCIERKRR